MYYLYNELRALAVFSQKIFFANNDLDLTRAFCDNFLRKSRLRHIKILSTNSFGFEASKTSSPFLNGYPASPRGEVIVGIPQASGSKIFNCIPPPKIEGMTAISVFSKTSSRLSTNPS